MQPFHLALIVTILPFIAIHGAHALSAYLGEVPWCIPYLTGCTSISRAARQDGTIFFFRALMMPYAPLLVLFWYCTYRWLLELGDRSSKRPLLILYLGSLAALPLVVYVDFLGTTGQVYQLLRRFGVVFYFMLTGFSQLLLVSRLALLAGFPRNYLQILFAICLAQLSFGLANIAVALTIEHADSANNVIEWCFAFLMHLFFVVTGFAWRRTGLKVSYTLRASEG